MSGVSVKYKNTVIASLDASGTKTLKTSGKYCEGDFTLQYEKPSASELTSGTKNITENGDYDVSIYKTASVNVPMGVDVSGTKEITSNGTHNVTTYENVNVNVHIPTVSELVSGTKSITTNGTHDVTSYKDVSVNVPIPSGYVKPSGTKTVTENGTHDVTNYASVTVNVESEQPNYLVVDWTYDGTSTAWVTLFKNDILAEHLDDLVVQWRIQDKHLTPSGANILYGVASVKPFYTKADGTDGYSQVVHYYNTSSGAVSSNYGNTSLVNTTTSTPSQMSMMKLESDGTLKMFIKSAYKPMVGTYRFVFTW